MQTRYRTIWAFRALRAVVSFAPCVAVGLTTAMAARPALADESPAAAPVQQVPLPYSFRDNTGNQWDVQADGCIGPGQADIFDAGGRLFVGQNEQYAGNTPTANFDQAHNELIFSAQQIAGLSVSRRVCFDAAKGFCRWTEVLENTTGAAVKTQVHVNFDLGGAVQSSQNAIDEKSHKAIGVALFDGNRGIAVLGGGRGAGVSPSITSQQNGDQVDFVWEVQVPAHKTAVVVHLAAIRPNMNDAKTFLDKLADKDALHDLPAALIKAIVNFASHSSSFGDLEILRGDLLDVVELRGGDQYKGTIAEKSFSLQTPYGLITLPAEKVLAMLAVGEFRPTQLIITRDGEAFGGVLQAQVMHVQLSSGQTTQIPISSIHRFGYRKQPGDVEEFKYSHPMLILRNGDRVAVEMPAGPIAVSTRYGSLLLKSQEIAALVFAGEDQPMYEVLLTDGSRIAALIAGDSLQLRPISTGASSAVGFPIASISRLQFVQKIEEPAEGMPLLSLSTGDRLAGTLSGKLSIDTAFDSIDIDGAEVRGLRRAGTAAGEVQIKLWDDTTLSGRLKGDVIQIALKSGPVIHVPTALVEEYVQPQPLPPPSVLIRLRALVTDLSSNDWKQADRAGSELGSMGPKIVGALKTLRPQQSKTAQERIDAILAKFEPKAPPTTKPTENAAPGN